MHACGLKHLLKDQSYCASQCNRRAISCSAFILNFIKQCYRNHRFAVAPVQTSILISIFCSCSLPTVPCVYVPSSGQRHLALRCRAWCVTPQLSKGHTASHQMRLFLLIFPTSTDSGALKAALYLSPLSFSSMD